MPCHIIMQFIYVTRARDGSIAWRRFDTLPLNLKKKERGRCDLSI